jgi:hypothetical protein
MDVLSLVSGVCCVRCGRGNAPIPRPEESYRVFMGVCGVCVCVCVGVSLRMIRCNNNPLHLQ